MQTTNATFSALRPLLTPVINFINPTKYESYAKLLYLNSLLIGASTKVNQSTNPLYLGVTLRSRLANRKLAYLDVLVVSPLLVVGSVFSILFPVKLFFPVIMVKWTTMGLDAYLYLRRHPPWAG